MNILLLKKWLAFSKNQKIIEQTLERKLYDEFGLSLNEFYVLFFLYNSEQKKMQLRDLESCVYLTQSSLSRMINNFSKKDGGMIEKFTCPQDKRGVYIQLTDIGEEEFKKSFAIVNTILNENFES